MNMFKRSCTLKYYQIHLVLTDEGALLNNNMLDYYIRGELPELSESNYYGEAIDIIKQRTKFRFAVNYAGSPDIKAIIIEDDKALMRSLNVRIEEL